MNVSRLLFALVFAADPATWAADDAGEQDQVAIDDDAPERGRREANALDAARALRGRVLAGALTFDEIAVVLRSDDTLGEGVADFELVIRSELHHDFDSALTELQLGVAVLPQDELEFVSRRLDAAPLHLTQQELERPFPSPIATVFLTSDAEQIAAGLATNLDTAETFDDVKIERPDLGYLVVVQGYSFVAPSERDVMTVLDHGGPADLAALAAWASAVANDNVQPFDVDGRRRVMDRVIERIGALRAPPAWGDFQRLNALTALTHACADRSDLERMLAVGRAMGVLLASSLVSHDGATAEENALGLSIHGFARMPARSEAAVSWEAATRRIRILALDRLLRLSFDPLDFRQAPATTARHPRLRQQARELLAPIAPTAVPQVLDATEGRVDVQREALRFYVEVHHIPVADPLTTWLVAHPQEVVDVGLEAMRTLGTAMLPVLLRRHGDMDATSAEREIVWRLLSALPESHAGDLAEALRSLGVEIVGARGSPPTVEVLLAALREHDARAVLERIDELAARIADEGASDRVALRGRMRAAEQLVDLAPERAADHADAIIALYVAAAREFDLDNPGERNTVTARLLQLPLGARLEDAARAATLINVELLLERRRTADAEQALLAYDPELTSAPIRERYVQIVAGEYRRGRDDHDWARASAALDRIEAHVPEALDVAAAREELRRVRMRPWLIAGMLLGSAAIAVGGVFARRLRAMLPGGKRPADASFEPAEQDQSAEAAAPPAIPRAPASDAPRSIVPVDPPTRVLEADPFDDFDAFEPAAPVAGWEHAANGPAPDAPTRLEPAVASGSATPVGDEPHASTREPAERSHAAVADATDADPAAAADAPDARRDGWTDAVSSPLDEFVA